MKKILFLLLISSYCFGQYPYTVNNSPLILNGSIVTSSVQATTEWKPTDIAGCKLWLDAGQGITLNGISNVSAWADQSGNTNNALQSTETNQPLYIDTAHYFATNKTIRFGGNDFLEIADNSSIDFTTGFTAFLVLKISTNSYQAFITKWDYSTQGCWGINNGTGAAIWNTWIYVANALNDGGVNSVHINTLGAGVYSANNSSLINFVYDGTQVNNADRIKFYGNGNLISQVVNGTIATSLQNSSATLKIGKWGGTLDRYLTGDIAEIIIYNKALNTEDRQKVENYLKIKQGTL